MASEHDPEREAEGSPEPDIVQRLDAIDGSLQDHIENDARLQSGVPAGQRPTDLDFIQMSGLTRPQNPVRSHSDEIAASTEEPDLDTSKPLSFFERGVTDVDSEMASEAPDHLEEPEPMALSKSTPALSDDFEDLPMENTPEFRRSLTPDLDEAEPAALPQSMPTLPDELDDFEDLPTANTPEFRMSLTPDLEEAEQLLQALESQPREISVPTPTREAASPLPQTLASPVSMAETIVSASIPVATQPVNAVMPATMSASPPQKYSDDVDEKRSEGYDYPLAVDLDPEKAEDAKDADGEERDASVYTKPIPGKHTRRSKGSTSHTWGRLIRLFLRVAFLVFLFGLIALILTQYRQRTQPTMHAYTLAQQTKEAGKFREASDAFKNFAATHPDDPLKVEAEFQAAYCMQQAPTSTTPFDEQQSMKTAALDLYKQFVANNPAHEKTARAKVIIGLLSVDLGRFPEGIEILQDPDLLLADPDAALPALRALAVARLKVGNRDAAASAYLQATALSRNYTPEFDLDALAKIYSDQAHEASNEDERKRLLKQAVDRLNDAIRLSSVDPSVRNTLQTKRDYILKELGEPIPENEGNPPPVANTPAAATPVETPAQQPPAPGVPESPANVTPETTNTAPSAVPPVIPEATVAPATSSPAVPTVATPMPVDPTTTVPAPAPVTEPTTATPATATPDPHEETQYPNTAK